MDEHVRDILLGEYTNKALATTGPHGINVVPVSAIRIQDNTIYLHDFFMQKTTENIKQTQDVSLVAWSGSVGYQIKATCEYLDSGEEFQAASAWVNKRHPTRTLQGVLVLTSTGVFDISLS